MAQQIKMLQTYESIDGGWGYYDFNAQTKQPSGSSISFVNATGLVALKDANKSGVQVPTKLVNRALSAIKRQRLPDHSYLYGEYLKYRQGEVSIGRQEVLEGQMPVIMLFKYGVMKQSLMKFIKFAWID